MRSDQLIIFANFILIVCIVVITACASNSVNENKTTAPTVKEEANTTPKNPTINWMTLPEMETAMLSKPKDILIMVYAIWCEESKRYEETTYQESNIIKYINEHYYAVKVDAEEAKTLTYRGKEYNIHPNTGHNEIVYELKARSIPCLVFLDEDFELQGHKMGYTNMEDLDELLFTYND